MKFTTREDMGSGGSAMAKGVCRDKALSQRNTKSGFMQVNFKQEKLNVKCGSLTECEVFEKQNPQNKRVSDHSKLGQSLVEFALVLPILILIVYGVFDLGRAFYALVTVANASREGVRYMTRHDIVMSTSVNNSLLLVRDQVKQEALGGGLVLDDSLITIDCVRSPLDSNNCLSGSDAWVIVKYDFRPLFAAIFPTTIRIGWESRMMMP